VAEALARIRAQVPALGADREPAPDVATVTALVRAGAFDDLVG
jgi:histidine ammonia-lyase